MKKLQKVQGKKRGITMIEMGLVLTIGAILIGGVVLMFERRANSAEVADNVNNITDVAANMKSRFGTANRYPALTTAVAVQSGAIPATLREGAANTARNSYGGAITIAPTAAADCGGSASGCSTLTWSAVKGRQCNDLVLGAESAARSVAIDGTVVKVLDGVIDAAATAAQCDDNTAKDITMVIGR